MDYTKEIKYLESLLSGLKANNEPEKEPVILEMRLKFEVYPTDLSVSNWSEAKKACEALGDDWRLPTRVELLIMYENQDDLPLKYSFNRNSADYYWSSTETDSSHAWEQDFGSGFQGYANKNGSNYGVRAVRTLKNI